MTLILNSRLARAKANRNLAQAPKHLTLLESASLLAQIFLSFVAIFGYFYTVRPVYQKEQLAEQVAEYDSIIKKQTPKIKEIESQLTALRSDRAQLSMQLEREREQLRGELQTERTKLTGELNAIEKQLSIAREEKSRIENQVQFMTYRYRLPDGRPAVTQDQVNSAQRAELRRSLMSTVWTDCTFGLGSAPFGPYVYLKADAASPTWPFTPQELTAWRENGARYPVKRAKECVESAIARYAKKTGTSRLEEVESFRKEALQFLERESEAKPWSPPMEPQDIVNELAERRAQIESERVAQLKEVEEKYKDWDKSFLPDRRAILKFNFATEKINVRNDALGKTWEAEGKARVKADALRKAVFDETKRLIIADRTPAVR